VHRHLLKFAAREPADSAIGSVHLHHLAAQKPLESFQRALELAHRQAVAPNLS